MHREHLVEYFRRHEGVEGADELDPHDGGFDAAEHEKQQRIKDVQQPETLVVDRSHPEMKPFHERALRRSGPRRQYERLSRHQRKVSMYAVTALTSASLNPMAGILDPGLMTSGF